MIIEIRIADEIEDWNARVTQWRDLERLYVHRTLGRTFNTKAEAWQWAVSVINGWKEDNPA